MQKWSQSNKCNCMLLYCYNWNELWRLQAQTVILNCIYLAQAQFHQHCVVFTDVAFSSFQKGRLNEKLHGLKSVVHLATFSSSTHPSIVQLKTREMPRIPDLQVLMFDPSLNWIWITMLTGIPTEVDNQGCKVCQLVCSRSCMLICFSVYECKGIPMIKKQCTCTLQSSKTYVVD